MFVWHSGSHHFVALLLGGGVLVDICVSKSYSLEILNMKCDSKQVYSLHIYQPERQKKKLNLNLYCLLCYHSLQSLH